MSRTPFAQRIQETVHTIRALSDLQPQAGLILGSGLGDIVDEMTNVTAIPYRNIPHFHGTSIEGHPGKMVLGELSGVPTVVLQGRFHYYEGHTMEDVVYPTRVLHRMGVQSLILTNAAGGVNTRFRPGDLMIIEDHLNLMGQNPLIGPNLTELGPRFPDLTEAYSKSFVELLKKEAEKLQIPVHSGVYAGLPGPTYETPAEVRMLRTLGADAVGMSTVPEAIAANHIGIKVAGISCITNLAAGLSPHKLSHSEVMELSQVGAKKLKKLLYKAFPQLVHQNYS